MMINRRSIIAISLSASALVGIALHEGYKDEAYIPIPGDVPTIGFGTTAGVKMGDKTTPTKALVRALADVQKYEGAIKSCVKVPLHQYEYDAYTMLTYNIGSGAFCKSTLVKKLNASDYSGACREIDRWVYANGKKINGLVKRRAHERALCEGKDDGRA